MVLLKNKKNCQWLYKSYIKKKEKKEKICHTYGRNEEEKEEKKNKEKDNGKSHQ